MRRFLFFCTNRGKTKGGLVFEIRGGQQEVDAPFPNPLHPDRGPSTVSPTWGRIPGGRTRVSGEEGGGGSPWPLVARNQERLRAKQECKHWVLPPKPCPLGSRNKPPYLAEDRGAGPDPRLGLDPHSFSHLGWSWRASGRCPGHTHLAFTATGLAWLGGSGCTWLKVRI